MCVILHVIDHELSLVFARKHFKVCSQSFFQVFFMRKRKVALKGNVSGQGCHDLDVNV